MTGQLELYNLLTVVLLVGGIAFACIALAIFLSSGIREYFILTHHDVNKDIEKETNGVLEENEELPEDHSIISPSEILGEPKIEEAGTPRQAIVIDPDEDGAGETAVTAIKEEPKETTFVYDEDGAGETIAMDDGSGETTAIKKESGHTEDLGKPSAIREDQKGTKREEEDALTGVLDDDAAETAMLDKGEDDTSSLDAKRAKRLRQNTIRDDTLWGAPLANTQMTDAHNIVMVNTDRKLDPVPDKGGTK